MNLDWVGWTVRKSPIDLALLIFGVLAIGKSLLFLSGYSPFTQSYTQSMFVDSVVAAYTSLMMMGCAIIYNQMVIKRTLEISVDGEADKDSPIKGMGVSK
jgi:hypothetical protein